MLLFTEGWGGPQGRQNSELSSARMKCIFKASYSAGDFVGLLVRQTAVNYAAARNNGGLLHGINVQKGSM